jgi:hypothetical protein
VRCGIRPAGPSPFRALVAGFGSVSKAPWAMFLDGDLKALRAYHKGDPTSEVVALYFKRVGLGDLVVISLPSAKFGLRLAHIHAIPQKWMPRRGTV